MSRTGLIIALILMLLTGLVVGQMRALTPSPEPIAAPSGDRAAATARAFYAAINRHLAEGDTAPLLALLAPGFVDHSAHRVGEQPAPAFIRYLEALRTAFPGLRLEATDLSTQTGIVAVDVELAGPVSGSRFDLPLDVREGERGYEVLRIEGDRIAERWGSRALPGLIEMVASADLPAPAMSELLVERLTIAPRGRGAFADRNGFIIVVESGEIAFHIDRLPGDEPGVLLFTTAGAGPRMARPGESITLTPGMALAAPPDIQFRVANRGEVPATALAIAMREGDFGPKSPVPYLVIESSGIERTFLASQPLPVLLDGARSRAIAVTRAELPSGTLIPRHDVPAAELLVVSDGALEMAVFDGSASWFPLRKRLVVVEETQIVGAGESLSAAAQASVQYRVREHAPATVWVVTMSDRGIPPEGTPTLPN
jgi:hypothetical protein